MGAQLLSEDSPRQRERLHVVATGLLMADSASISTWQPICADEENTSMNTLFTRFVRDEQGQDLIEYALLAAFVGLVVVGGATFLGDGLNTWYNTLGDNISKMDAQP
jgi:pilus assembly protein Flp/PilA